VNNVELGKIITEFKHIKMVTSKKGILIPNGATAISNIGILSMFKSLSLINKDGHITIRRERVNNKLTRTIAIMVRCLVKDLTDNQAYVAAMYIRHIS